MGLSIGVDIGGTKILAGTVTDDGEIVATARRSTPRDDASGVLDLVADVVNELASATAEPIEGVGVGVAGLVDADRSKVYFAPNLRWSQVPARALLEAATGLPVVIENDGNVAAWGEFRFGAGQGSRDLTLVTVGTGIGGTKILAGTVTDDGEIVATARRSTPRDDASGVLDLVADVVNELAGATDEPIEGVGVGVAGLVDADRSKVYFAPNLRWSQVPARALLEAATGLPVVIENDSNVAAWGEFRFGAGQGSRDLTLVTVGTGIGGGIVIDGRLFRGAHGAAGEIGHLNAVPDGRPCGCGRNGCLEQYASGNALVREARMLAADRRSEAGALLALGDGTPEGVQGVHITEAARAGDPVATEAFAIVGTWLGRGLADLAATLDPDVFVVGGGVSEAGDLLLASARQTLADKIIGQHNRPIPVVREAQLGNSAGLVGAADLARLR